MALGAGPVKGCRPQDSMHNLVYGLRPAGLGLETASPFIAIRWDNGAQAAVSLLCLGGQGLSPGQSTQKLLE